MAMFRQISRRRDLQLSFHRYCSSLTVKKPSTSHHNEHSRNHEYLSPTSFIGSWNKPNDPKEAESKLAKLRRDYSKQVKEMRKQYIYEMEMQRQEKIRKDEATREEILRKREERRKTQAVAAEARAAERKVFEEDFHHTLMKERSEKLEYWRKREKTIDERKNSKKEVIRKKSSLWIDEKDLEGAISNALNSSQFL